jgi:CNT family concentrative nucleoside transporter
MSAPGGILMAKIIMPDELPAPREPEGKIALPKGRISAEGPAAITEGEPPHEVVAAESFDEHGRAANIIEAAAQGAQTGVRLAVAVGAMVRAFDALVALANGLLGGIGDYLVAKAADWGRPFNPDVAAWLSSISFQKLLGYLFAPVMYLLGIPWNEAVTAGGLFGTKIVLNEFVAFIDLGQMGPDVLSARARAIVTFALCGFANFSSIAIQMAVTGGLAPNQRPVIARLGLRALAAGSLANLMSAALAGLFLSL